MAADGEMHTNGVSHASDGDLGSAAIVVAAYMYYSAMCASADQALDRFAMKRFYEDKLAVVIQPSQRRYVDYFHGLLSGTILMNSNPIFLHRVILHQVLGQKPGGRVFLRVYQGMQPCYTSPIYSRMDATACDKLCITIFPMLKLKGDILVKCYQKIAGGRQVIFRMQFHTCVVQGPDLLLGKKELDEACTDLLFPLDGKVELLFSSSSAVATTSKAFLQNDRSITVDHSSLDPILRYDSYVDLSLLLDAGGKHETAIGYSSGKSKLWSSVWVLLLHPLKHFLIVLPDLAYGQRDIIQSHDVIPSVRLQGIDDVAVGFPTLV
uniref:tensin-1-like n=1 Tax=Myxine glutinosa TaxID=7769 RepID=UPI00358ED734